MIEKALSNYQKVNLKIIENLETFALPIFQDTVQADERPDLLNLFIVLFGNWNTIDDGKRQLQQDVYVIYLSENRDDVDEMTIKIAHQLKIGNMLKFVSSEKDYVQKSGTEQYVDRVIMKFARNGGVVFEC